MKKCVAIALVVACALLVTSASTFARGRGHGGHHGGHHRTHHGFHHGTVFVGVAPLIAFGPAYPYGWYPTPSYVYPPPIAPWYYCPSSRAYYPDVPSCPEPWVPIPPRW